MGMANLHLEHRSGEWSRQQLNMFAKGGFGRVGEEWLPP